MVGGCASATELKKLRFSKDEGGKKASSWMLLEVMPHEVALWESMGQCRVECWVSSWIRQMCKNWQTPGVATHRSSHLLQLVRILVAERGFEV